MDDSPESRNRLRQLLDAVNEHGTYHKLELGKGLIVKGEYDMTKYVHHYRMPTDLKDQSVLDIGTATGFFAFECARRRARVTAIDLWDGSLFRELQWALGLEVHYVQKNIYDLDEVFGKFDLVICGSLLLHLGDIFGAIQKIRSVCKRRAIISTAFLEDPERADRGYCEFIGAKGLTADGREYGTYWTVGRTALKRMLLAAGFAEVQEVATFTIESEPEGHGFSVPHVVMHALV